MVSSTDKPDTLGTEASIQLYHDINPAHGSGGKDVPDQPGSRNNLMV